VVASEVRNLARRSAKAAQEIKRLIHDSVARVNTGTERVNNSGEILEAIRQSITEVRALVAEIAGNTQQQATRIEALNVATCEIHAGNQQNTALVEEVAASAAMMSERARDAGPGAPLPRRLAPRPTGPAPSRFTGAVSPSPTGHLCGAMPPPRGTEGTPRTYRGARHGFSADNPYP